MSEREWECAARAQGTAGGNDPADCDWPWCGCDPNLDTHGSLELNTDAAKLAPMGVDPGPTFADLFGNENQTIYAHPGTGEGEMSEKLCDFEREILEEFAGLRPHRPWGAAVGAALEFLNGMGFVRRDGELTDKGRAALEKLEKAK